MDPATNGGPLQPEFISDNPIATYERWSVANEWDFIAASTLEDCFVSKELIAWKFGSGSVKSVNNHLLTGVLRIKVGGGRTVVRYGDVCEAARKRAIEEVTHRSNFSNRHFKPLLRSIDIEERGFHQCRHTAATTMLNSGAVAIKLVSKILGHEKVSTTLDMYNSLLVADQEQAVDFWNKRLA